MFDYLPVIYMYDRGRGIASIADVDVMVAAFADIARLWVPDKFLRAREWDTRPQGRT